MKYVPTILAGLAVGAILGVATHCAYAWYQGVIPPILDACTAGVDMLRSTSWMTRSRIWCHVSTDRSLANRNSPDELLG